MNARPGLPWARGVLPQIHSFSVTAWEEEEVVEASSALGESWEDVAEEEEEEVLEDAERDGEDVEEKVVNEVGEGDGDRSQLWSLVQASTTQAHTQRASTRSLAKGRLVLKAPRVTTRSAV